MNNILKILVLLSLITSSSIFAMKNNKTKIEHYQNLEMENGYKAIFSSEGPLIKGKNNLSIRILKNNSFVKNADVNIIFALPITSSIEFSEHALENKDKYDLNVNFKVPGEWKYELMFKTSYGAIYSQEGRVIIN